NRRRQTAAVHRPSPLSRGASAHRNCPSRGWSTTQTAGRRRLWTSEVAIQAGGQLNVEQKMADVAILHDILLAFDTQFASLANLLFTSVSFQIGQRVNFDADEAAFEVAVDHAGG